jgi:hypothetical protein
MSAIDQLFAAMTTRDTDNSGTDSPIMLIGNVNGSDRIQYTFPATSQDDQSKGQANLYTFGVSINLDSTDLPASYFRVGIRGSDAWRPETFFLWGSDANFSNIVPMGIRFDPTTQFIVREVDGESETNGNLNPVVLSTDNSEGDLSFPLFPIPQGNEATVMNRLLVLITTADSSNAGTNDKITISLPLLKETDDYQLPDTTQADLNRGQANWYEISLFKPFAKNQLNVQGGIGIFTSGSDAWLPESFFIFGLDTDQGMPNFIVPLVHIPKWTFGSLSHDFGEGKELVQLPIVLP